MKIALDYGHCLTGADLGARGQGFKEETLTREIGYKVKSKLEALGHTVIVISPNHANSLTESLNSRVYNANKQSVDLSISIHLNAGGGEGTEIFTKGGKIFEEAYNILTNLGKLGYKTRGIKNGNEFALVGSINCNKSMLVECCFIDSLRDMTIYDSEKIASAIAKGIDNKNNNEKVEYDMKRIVVYYGDADVFAAVIVAQKKSCPLMKLDQFKASGLKAEEVIQIGGKPEEKNRYETFKNAAKLV